MNSQRHLVKDVKRWKNKDLGLSHIYAHYEGLRYPRAIP